MQDTENRDTSFDKGQELKVGNDQLQLYIGAIGLFLPFILLAAVMIAPSKNLPTVMYSVSAYYYTSGISVLEGSLAILFVFLLNYQGYEKSDYHWADRLCARVAAGAAFVVAICPTYPPGYPHPLVAAPSWWAENVGKAHDWSAVTMFLMFAVFSWLLFPQTSRENRTGMTRDKKRRNIVYYLCGAAILGGGGFVVYLNKTQPDVPVFWPESVAIAAFSVSWLVKGGVLRHWMRDQQRSGDAALARREELSSV